LVIGHPRIIALKAGDMPAVRKRIASGSGGMIYGNVVDRSLCAAAREAGVPDLA
jgi:hypothetical protein